MCLATSKNTSLQFSEQLYVTLLHPPALLLSLPSIAPRGTLVEGKSLDAHVMRYWRYFFADGLSTDVGESLSIRQRSVYVDVMS